VNQPLVSIIVPVYNVAPYLEQCVESIRTQSYSNFQCFLVDDGSTDGSAALCDRAAAADSRFIALHKSNSGVSDARNQAMDLAEGKYLQFADGDDWLAPDATETFVRAAEITGCDLVIAHFYRVAGERQARRGHIKTGGVMTRREFAEQMVKAPANYYYGVLWNKLYRRSIVEEGGLRCDPEVSWCEDFLFNLEYIRRTRLIAATAQPVYCYVKRPGSLVATQATLARTVEMKRTMFAAYKRLYQALDLYDEQKLRVYGYLVSAAKDGGSVALRPPALPKRRPESPRRRTRRRRTGMA